MYRTIQRLFAVHSLITILFPVLVSGGVVVISLLPLLRFPATMVTDPSDGVLVTWIQTKIIDNLVARAPIFEGNIFYPHRYTLLYSDSFISLALLASPVRLFTNEPFVLNSFSYIFSQFTTCLALYFLFMEISSSKKGEGSVPLSIAGSVAFTLSPLHMHYAGHLQVFALQFLVIGIWGMLAFLRTAQLRFLCITSCMFILQVWQSIFLAYIMAIIFCIFALYRPFAMLYWNKRRSLAALGLGSSLVCMPILFGYLRFSQEFNVVRDIREVIHFSLIPKDLVQKFFSPVVYMLIVVGVGLQGILTSKKRVVDPRITRSFLVGIVLMVFAFGPALHLGETTVKIPVFGQSLHVPLPYIVLYYGAPGFKAFRTPSRFVPIACIMFLTAAIALLSRLTEKKKRSRIMFSLFIVTITLLFYSPLTFYTMPTRAEYPAYVDFISKRSEKTVATLPLHDWADPNAYKELTAMLYSLKHRKAILNGASGFHPPKWMKDVYVINALSLNDQLAYLASKGIELVVIERQLTSAERTKLSTFVVYEDLRSAVLVTSSRSISQ